MKKIYLLLFLLIIKEQVCFGQITFQKIYGGNGDDEGYAVQQTSDGGYIITGYAESFGTVNRDIYLLKTDSLGNLLWTKIYEGINNDIGHWVQQTSDGGYIIAGITNNDACLIKTDVNGDTLWTKVFGGLYPDYAYCVKQTSDGGFIVSGSIYHDAFLMKTDSTGNVLWAKTYGDIGTEYARSVLEKADGGFVAAGGSGMGPGGASFYLFETDGSGNLLWSKTYGGTSGSHEAAAYSVQKTSDSGYIISGWRDDFGTSCNRNVYIVKTDSIGNMLWAKQIDQGLDKNWHVFQTDDGGYMLAGSTFECTSNEYDAYLIRTNTFGTPMWSKSIGGPLGIDDAAYSFQRTPDGGCIIVGSTNNTVNGDDNVYLIKVDSNGTSGCYENNLLTSNQGSANDTITAATVVTNISSPGIPYPFIVGTGGTDSTFCFSSTGINETANENSFIISPNPFTTSLSIKGIQKGEIKIFDLTGKEILRQKIINTETKINTEHLSPGFYLVNYSKENISVNSKIVKF